MKTIVIKSVLTLSAVALFICSNAQSDNRITFNSDTVNRNVDVIIDGKIFTSYIYPKDLEKPVLFPIYTASGIAITRGFPLDPQPNEQIDHPYQVGLWFNFADVNGIDFWNNSYAIPADQKSKYGSIIHRQILEAKDGKKRGILETTSDWVDSEGKVLLTDRTKYVFSGEGNRRIIRHTIVLTAQVPVVFDDNMEGLIAIRVSKELEEPSYKSEVFFDEEGNPAQESIINSEAAHGFYRNSEGKRKESQVWGKPAAWVCLYGTVNNENISIAIIDDKKNPGYPARSHARGYGLFATNNIGNKSFDKDAPLMTIALKPGETVKFTHIIVIQNGHFLSDDELNELSKN